MFSAVLYVPTKNPSACGMGVARRTQPETEKVGATLGFRVPELILPPLAGGFLFFGVFNRVLSSCKRRIRAKKVHELNFLLLAIVLSENKV